MKYPDDNSQGGSITFEFDNLVDLDTVYILDIDETKPVKMEVTSAGTVLAPIYSPPQYHGDNGLFPLAVNKKSVSKLVVTFPGSGAVAQLDYRHVTCPTGDGAGALTQIATEEPSASPSDTPTPAPTKSPSASPSRSPSSSPTDGPSSSPSKSPSASPSSSPSASLHVQPLAVAQLLSSDPETEVTCPRTGQVSMPGNNEALTAPGEVVSPYYSDGSSVKCKGHQYWLDKSLSWVCFVWTDPATGDKVARKQEGMSSTESRTIESKCVNGKATIEVYAHDGQFPKTSLATYPKACAGTQQDGTVGYTFEVPCGYFGVDDGVAADNGSSATTNCSKKTSGGASSSGGGGGVSNSGGKKKGGKRRRLRRKALAYPMSFSSVHTKLLLRTDAQ